MAEGASRSALNVAFSRAVLTGLGAVDDPHALGMLPRNGRRAAVAVQLPGLRLATRHPSFPYLAARTRSFDRFVTDALDAGIRQVVVLAAGYDSRAWRLARPGVAFFEVDRGPTQARKRDRAPAGGPTFPPWPTGWRRPASTRHRAAPGSRLAISFELGFERQAVSRRIMTTYSRRNGEDLRFRLPADDVPAFLAEAGWTVDDVAVGDRLDAEHLTGTGVAGRLASSSSIARASRRD